MCSDKKKSPDALQHQVTFLLFNWIIVSKWLFSNHLLSFLDINALRWNIWYSATVEVIQCRLCSLIIQSNRIDTRCYKVFYDIIKVEYPILCIWISLILFLTALIEMQRAGWRIPPIGEYTPTDPVRNLLMTHIYICQVEAGIECIEDELLDCFRQVNLLQFGIRKGTGT